MVFHLHHHRQRRHQHPEKMLLFVMALCLLSLGQTTCLSWAWSFAPVVPKKTLFVQKVHHDVTFTTRQQQQQRGIFTPNARPIRALWASTLDNHNHNNNNNNNNNNRQEEEEELDAVVGSGTQKNNQDNEIEEEEDAYLFVAFHDESVIGQFSSHAEEEDDDEDDDDDNDSLSSSSETIFPYLDSWHLTEEGCIAGIVSNHATYETGHLIVTSQLESPSDAMPDSIVTTITGSQYMLTTQPMPVKLEHWKITSDGLLRGSVEYQHDNPELVELLLHGAGSGQEITTCTPIAQPLDAEEWQPDTIVTTVLGTRYVLGQPYRYPLLDQWKRLEGGSIAGVVRRHSVIPDGEVITTSPLVEYDESQNGLVLVTTASGSQYELGQPEQQAQIIVVNESVVVEDQEEVEEAPVKEEDVIPTTHMHHHSPKPPSTNPFWADMILSAMPLQRRDSQPHVPSQDEIINGSHSVSADGDTDAANNNNNNAAGWNQTVWNTP